MRSRTSTTLLEALHDPSDEAAWRRFRTRYEPLLRSYARRVGLFDADAQDVAADTLATFLTAYRAGRYDRTRARLKSWLGGIRGKLPATLN
jgi:DNA-directed RNA polymerase specialized sigma24 family protein